MINFVIVDERKKGVVVDLVCNNQIIYAIRYDKKKMVDWFVVAVACSGNQQDQQTPSWACSILANLEASKQNPVPSREKQGEHVQVGLQLGQRMYVWCHSPDNGTYGVLHTRGRTTLLTMLCQYWSLTVLVLTYIKVKSRYAEKKQDQYKRLVIPFRLAEYLVIQDNWSLSPIVCA